MKKFSIFLAEGKESRTSEYYTDLAGKNWPIYVKRIPIPALANAGAQDIPHVVPTIKLNGHFNVQSLQVSNAGNTARATLQDARITNIVLKDATAITITNTADLTTYVNGSIVIEYCKTTD